MAEKERDGADVMSSGRVFRIFGENVIIFMPNRHTRQAMYTHAEQARRQWMAILYWPAA